MTDIQRHIKDIRKLLFQFLDDIAPGEALNYQTIIEHLRQLLPDSYGIAQGAIYDGKKQESHLIQILIYDVPLARYPYSYGLWQTKHRIQHVLMVIDIIPSHDAASLGAALLRLASVKQLDNKRDGSRKKQKQELPVGQRRQTIPKQRLPYALLVCDHFGHNDTVDEATFRQVAEVLKTSPTEYLPDEMIFRGQSIQYFNPLLEERELSGYDISLSKLPDLAKPQACYVCKEKFFRQHFFYDKLCIRCGDINYHKRQQTADLTGYIALVTGARVKIGYAAALKLLRAGATVITTSRFPRDAAQRYAQEADFEQWSDRLHVYGLDLRYIQQVELFVQHLYDTYLHLDILVNNAAQTIKRPPAYYAHLLPLETKPLAELPPTIQSLVQGEAYHRPMLETIEQASLDNEFPQGAVDAHGQQVDNRDVNSWIMRMEDVPMPEIVEVHLVNAVVPGVFAGQLKRLLECGNEKGRYIVNVAAAEGQFAQFKNGIHPHTNMAKAALNMLTRTIAQDYANSRIYVTSVDPGWVSDQVPRMSDESRTLAEESLPIDMEDAAARICDPIFAHLNGDDVLLGCLVKDYQVAAW